MYENLYFYSEQIHGKNIYIRLKPNFREAITLYTGDNEVVSDGKVWMKGELCLNDDPSDFPDVFVSEDAQWALESIDWGYNLFVTEKTNEISTPLGEQWNNEFNRLLKKCKEDYYRKKKEEIRLYFYDAARDKLQLCYLGDSYYLDHCKYSLSRYFSPYCAIDKRYAKPEKNCFILGRVRKTIGLKNSKLLDFIEPVHKISLDFEKDMWDFGGYEYENNIENIEKIIFDLLQFSIRKKYDILHEKRIRAYFKNYSGTQETVIRKFNRETWNSFKESNVPKMRQLYYVLNAPQDCTNVKFELRLEEEVTCSPDKNIYVFFENGEVKYSDARWVYENIHNCTDASGVYLGEMRNRYNFY